MHRRLIPLALAYVGGEEPVDGRTRLQKIVFVAQQQLIESGVFHEDQLYEFFAYDYGPFSKELAEDIDQMLEADLLDEEEVEYNEEGDVKYLYEVNSDGRKVVEQELDTAETDAVLETVRHLKLRYNEELSLPEVIDEVYAEYPEYAENSVY